MAVIYALFCLLCSAGNDFLFKLFARKPRIRGIFCAVIGVVWGLLTLLCFQIDWSTWKAILVWGSVIGVFSIAANLLLIEAMGMQSAGVCSTIYRLNLVPVVFGAWLLLGEKIAPFQWLGIILAIGAVFCFLTLSGTSGETDRKKARLGVFMVILAAFLRAGMGLSYKYAYAANADEFGITAFIALFWIVGGILYALFREQKQVKIDKSLFFYGTLSGLLVAGITIFMALALKAGKASVTLPIAQMSFPLTFLLSILFLKESVTRWKIIGVILSIAAVLLLCMAK